MTTTDGERRLDAASTDRSAGPPAAHGRIDALDGLRAIAVYLVVAFHAGLTRFEGGFIGVDVFFVLSGFLITRLLLVEHADSGRLDLPQFYARRVRRLLPASWIAIVTTSVVYLAVATPFEREAVVDDARASIFYVANWNFIREGQDYFAESIESSPFLHLWSLAVEEQFYIVWPLVMLGVLAIWRRSTRLATGLVIGSAVCGAAWALWMAGDNLVRAYYGTDTRAYQLLAGAGLAFVLTTGHGTLRPARWRSVQTPALVVGLGAIVVLATSFGVGPVDRGLLTAACTIVVIWAVVEAKPADRSSRRSIPITVLSSTPMVRLGNISYATYLWHWPIVIVLGRVFEIGPLTMFVVVALTSTGLAKLSMDLVERPIRRAGRNSTRRRDLLTIAAAIATTLALGLAIVPAILRSDVAMLRAVDRPGFSSTTPGADPPVAPVGNADALTDGQTANETPSNEAADDSAATTAAPATPPTTPVDEQQGELLPLPFGPAPTEPIPVPDDVGQGPVDTEYVEKSGCVNEVPDVVDDCVTVSGSGERVLLIGDSHATKLNAAFSEYADVNDLTFATISGNGCPWQDGLLYRDALPVEGAKQFCRDQRDALYDWFTDQYDPDVVVIANHDQTTERYDVEPRPERGTDEQLVGLALIDDTAGRSLDSLSEPGRRVVVLEPLPNSPFDPLSCLSAATFVDDCAFAVAQWPHAETPLLRDLAAARDGVSTVDMTPFACPHFPTCRPIVDGTIVREDVDHFDIRHALRITPALMSRLGL